MNPRTTSRPSSVFKTDTISHSAIRPKGGRPTGKRWDADVKNPTHLVGIDSQKRVKSNQHHYNNTESKLCQPLEDIFFANLKIPLQLLLYRYILDSDRVQFLELMVLNIPKLLHILTQIPHRLSNCYDVH